MDTFYASWVKRPFDLLLSGILLLIFSPLLLGVAALLLIREGRPVLFCQARPGLGEKTFTLIKFRTMQLTRPGETDPVSDEGRVTALGRFLRKTSIDELPELWNVLKGDMSLVGPRPLLIRYLPYFTPAERIRFTLLPGITGLAQIQGRNNASWDERLAADIEYAQTLGFQRDFQILLATVSKVLLRKDVQVAPSTAMLNLDQERASGGSAPQGLESSRQPDGSDA